MELTLSQGVLIQGNTTKSADNTDKIKSELLTESPACVDPFGNTYKEHNLYWSCARQTNICRNCGATRDVYGFWRKYG